MPKKGENIYKRKDGRWEGRYIRGRKNNRAVYGYVYGQTYHEVKEKQRFAIQHLTQMSGNRVREQYTLRMVADKWFYHTKPQVKESTYRKYQNIWMWYIEPALGDMPVSQLKNQHIESFCTELRVSGGVKKSGLSAGTVTAAVFLLRSMLHLAVKLDIPVSCDVRAVTVRQEQTDIRVFTHNEQAVLCRYLLSNFSLPEFCCACAPAFVSVSFAPSVGKIYACRIVYCACSTPCSESKSTCRPIKRRR